MANNAKFLGLVKKRNNAFRRAKWSGTSQAIGAIETTLYCSKVNSSNSFSSTSDSRTLWSYVNKLKKKPANVIPSLCSDNSLLHSPQEKSTLLNATFASHFNSSASPLQPIPPNQPFCRPPDLFCTPMSIENLMYSISGDQISLKMLKATFSSVSLPLTIKFNSSLNVQLTSKTHLSQFPRLPLPPLFPQNIVPSLSCPSPVNYSKDKFSTTSLTSVYLTISFQIPNLVFSLNNLLNLLFSLLSLQFILL